jgi:uncharacterized protein DUF1206
LSSVAARKTRGAVTTSAPSHTEARAAGLSTVIVESRPFEWFARGGFVARGAVYGVIGLLALKLALHADGGETTNQQGAMRTIAEQPLGEALLILLAAGLAGYSMWRLTRAVLGRGPEGSDKGIERVGALGSGLVYGALAVIAVQILLGSRGGQGGNAKKTTADVFDWPAGKWLVLVGGLVFIGISLYQAHRGLTKRFLRDSKTEEMPPHVKRWIARIGTVGHLARAVVFGLVGIFLVKAVVDFNPRDAVGLDGALAKVQQQTYGHLLLGVVAVGLLAFALYSISDARYRRI